MKTYTLEEAKQELIRQECLNHGHDYEIIVTMGRNAPDYVICQRCGLSWEVAVGEESI